MSKAEEINALQEAITEDNAKIMALGFLLQLAEPSEHGETREDARLYERLVYDIAGVIRDYTDRISSALSDLEFIARDLPEGEAEAG
ncbi:MAG: hypothetical protein IKO35_03875 [Elusimicrobiaceae bacterium]|nr:hypothetical protein [Elusimicrobiaceae bacterium]